MQALDSLAHSVILAVYKDGLTGGLQLNIEDEKGSGFRLVGPKFSGNSGRAFLRCVLTRRDADEIRCYLSRAFP